METPALFAIEALIEAVAPPTFKALGRNGPKSAPRRCFNASASVAAKAFTAAAAPAACKALMG